MLRAGFLITIGAVATSAMVPAFAAAARVAILASPSSEVAPEDVNHFVAQIGHAILSQTHSQVVTRTSIDAVLREQGFSNSNYADPATAARLGKIVGASRILHVTLELDTSESTGLVNHQRYEVTSDFELIDVSTARLVSDGSANGDEDRRAAGGGDYAGTPRMALRAALDACAANLVGQLQLS